MRQVSEILESIKGSLQKADGILWEATQPGGPARFEFGDKELIRYYLDRAFLQTMFFLEAQGLPRMLSYLEELYRRAKENYLATDTSSDGDPYLIWDSELRQFLSAIEASLGEPGSMAISKDLIEILRNCLYAITAPCFSEPPRDEGQVHERIEAMLKCVFPDLRPKPPIGKPIKNFVPDTGLPAVRTLIEYKFISNGEDAKRVADEVLADTRGYVSKDWDKFIYVIYETYRVKPEREWNQLMRASGVGENTKVVVLPGEPADKGKQVAVPGKSKSSA